LANQWQFLEYTFTATATSNEAQLWAVTPSVAGGKAWVDDVQVTVNRPGLAFRTRRSLFNTDPTLALDFAAAEVLPPFEPTDDDQQTQNDVSVTREGGGTLRQEITTGAMSTQLPPNGVGRYKGGGTFNVELDEDAQQLAAWLAHLGTVDEARYPQITVSLTRKPGLAAAASAVDLGHRVTISNPPDWLPPDLIDQMCQGYSEALDSRSWRIVFNCTPHRPYQVLRLDSVPNGKVGAHDSQVSTAVDSSTPTMLVKSASGMYERSELPDRDPCRWGDDDRHQHHRHHVPANVHRHPGNQRLRGKSRSERTCSAGSPGHSGIGGCRVLRR
jgi:hypothetical protein